MKLNKNDVKMMAFLLSKREKITLGKLAEQLGMKKSNASRYVKKLEKYKLVTVSKIGRTKEINGSYTHFLSFSKVKEGLPHIKLEDLLTGRMPHFLAYLYWYVRKQLNERKSVKFQVKDIDLPAITTKRLLRKMRSLGMAYQPSKGEYSTRKEAYEALRFCSDILTESYVAEAEEELRGMIGIRISFENPKAAECIFITETENFPKSYWPTAYTALDEYGVKLITAGRFYYTNVRPRVIDIAIHLLALDRDARSISYVCALLIKNPVGHNKILRKESRFGIPDKFLSNLIEFIETKGQKSFEGFPTWQEIEATIGNGG
jgi:DNA-binding transcriptional ArsR family regulator